jgi:hypothetical protein
MAALHVRRPEIGPCSTLQHVFTATESRARCTDSTPHSKRAGMGTAECYSRAFGRAVKTWFKSKMPLQNTLSFGSIDHMLHAGSFKVSGISDGPNGGSNPRSVVITVQYRADSAIMINAAATMVGTSFGVEACGCTADNVNIVDVSSSYVQFSDSPGKSGKSGKGGTGGKCKGAYNSPKQSKTSPNESSSPLAQMTAEAPVTAGLGLGVGVGAVAAVALVTARRQIGRRNYRSLEDPNPLSPTLIPV